MLITKLNMVNFRNYRNTLIDFGNNINVIYGNNAQGKTNILEAIFICASARSHRTSKDKELININEKNYHIGLQAIKDGSNLQIDINYEKDDKKKIFVNEIPVRKIGDLMGNLNAVMFSPEDMRIIKDGPAERRRMVDITMSQIRPSYFFDLQQYLKVMLQRNNLFKAIKDKKSLMSTLDVWNENLVKCGARLIKGRYDYILRLNALAERNHQRLTDNKEKLNIIYKPSIKVDRLNTISDIEKAFAARIEDVLEKEIILGTSLAGPHRDDYDLQVNDANVKIYGSQGQQRTVVLSLKLSEVDIMNEETGERPVLLLDDVLSELDSVRQEYLLSSIKNIQTFITATEKIVINKVDAGNMRYFKVVGGEVEADFSCMK